MPTPRDVIVVGCGVIGLTSALRLAEAGHRVRILAHARSPHTTSDIAAAIWFPFRTEHSERSLGWAMATLAFLRGLVGDAPAGVTRVEGVEAFSPGVDGPVEPAWRAGLDGFRRAQAVDLPPGHTDGFVFTVPVIQMPVHLRWLADRFTALGGEIETGVELSPGDLDRLVARVGMVVNCTGLGARELAPDASVYPIRGQIVRVAPGFAERFVQAAPEGATAVTYIIPRPDCTVLGGTTEPDRWDVEPDPAVAEAVRSRCIAAVPALAAASILSHAVGLRPGRSSIRLEAERRGTGWLMHNYGHGGAGVTLGWGCAGDVVRLMAQLD